MSEQILIAPAGWELRFEEGVYIDIDEFHPTKILLPFSQKYAERTLPARNKIRRKAELLKIQYHEFEQNYFDAVSLYKSTLDLFDTHICESAKVRFNATTTPRDIIWYTLHLLADKGIETQFSYFPPLKYGEDYLSRDARAPRFVLKRSGIAYPDLPTCILVLSGYDEERLSQLKQRYEPKKMLIGHQIGEQLDNQKRNFFYKNKQFDEESFFEFDCYDINDSAVKILCEKLDQLNNKYNIIAASLGPKPCAVTLFKLTQIRPEIGLVYIPAGDYSENYSEGIDVNRRVLGTLAW